MTGFFIVSKDTFLRVVKILLLAGILQPSQQLLADNVKAKLLDSNGQARLLSREAIREIFFMRLNAWPDGSPIRVFVLPDNDPVHIQFSKEVLGVFPFQLRSAWDRMVYSGTGVAPTTVETQEEMKNRIQATPGGIGYIGR